MTTRATADRIDASRAALIVYDACRRALTPADPGRRAAMRPVLDAWIALHDGALYAAAAEPILQAAALMRRYPDLAGAADRQMKGGGVTPAVLREAADSFGRQGARQQEAACWRELGELHLSAGDMEQAVEALRAGLEALDPRRTRA